MHAQKRHALAPPPHASEGYTNLRPVGRGVTMGALELAGLLRDEDGVAAAAFGVPGGGALLVTSISKPAHDAIPGLLPSWLTANDSQWSARSLAERENRWQRETPVPRVCSVVWCGCCRPGRRGVKILCVHRCDRYCSPELVLLTIQTCFGPLDNPATAAIAETAFLLSLVSHGIGNR